MIALLAPAVAASAPCQAPLLHARPLRAPPDAVRCLGLDVDAAARAFVQVPTVGLDRGVRMNRARAELFARNADVQARLAVDTVRSGGVDGYVGVNGEALVPVVQIAEARWDWRATGLALAAGLVDDLWTMTVQSPWRRALGRPLAEATGMSDRSDEGGWVSWTAPGQELSATVSVTAGEGADRRERNRGVDTAGLATLRPLRGDVTLDLALYGREGSRGLESARDHRAGASAVVGHDLAVASLDALLGWGIGGDSERLPAAVSLWGRTGPELPVEGWLRGDLAWSSRDAPASRQTGLLAGAGPRLQTADYAIYAVAGYERHRYGTDAPRLAASGRVTGTDMVFVQLGGRLRVAAVAP